MSRSPLTLAAVATSAVDGLDIVGTAPLGSPTGAFDTALLHGRDGGRWVIRVPRSPSAEAEQSADLGALRALTPGVRSRLPFAVATPLGQAPLGPTRAIVYEFLDGAPASLGRLDHALAASIGEAIAAIHGLPTSLVTDAGLPTSTPGQSRRETLDIVDRAVATGVVPIALQQRWMRAVEDAELWQFSPVVVNGTLRAASFLAAERRVSAVLGWHALQLGDPARDLAWLLAAPGDGIADTALGSYARHRGSVDRQLRERAALLAELELARWLLHGMAAHDTATVDDAVEMMSRLIDRISQADTGSIRKAPEPLDVTEVEELLARTARNEAAAS